MDQPWTAELCNKILQNQRRTQNIFGFSIFERQEQKQTKQNLFGFSNSKLTRRLRKPKTKNQRDNQRETTEIVLVFLCFGKQERKQQKKERKKAKHGYTMNRQNMICR